MFYEANYESIFSVIPTPARLRCHSHSQWVKFLRAQRGETCFGWHEMKMWQLNSREWTSSAPLSEWMNEWAARSGELERGTYYILRMQSVEQIKHPSAWRRRRWMSEPHHTPYTMKLANFSTQRIYIRVDICAMYGCRNLPFYRSPLFFASSLALLLQLFTLYIFFIFSTLQPSSGSQVHSRL